MVDNMPPLVEVMLYSRHYHKQVDRRLFPVSGVGGPEQVESVARLAWENYDDIISIPSMNYTRDPHEQAERLFRKMSMLESMQGIEPDMAALWCELKKHPFSAKDPDKVVLSFRGESRLACGECAAGFLAAGEAKAVTD
jgi:hypothetical protein